MGVTFKEKLYNIVREFNKLQKNQNKSKLLERRISSKLERSLENYYKNLEDTIKYLLSRNSVTILKGVISKFGKDKNND
jgi:hypothetical protein